MVSFYRQEHRASIINIIILYLWVACHASVVNNSGFSAPCTPFVVVSSHKTGNINEENGGERVTGKCAAFHFQPAFKGSSPKIEMVREKMILQDSPGKGGGKRSFTI